MFLRPWPADSRDPPEEGDIFAGEAFLVVTSTGDLPAKLEEASRTANGSDWRIRDIVYRA
jgi:hypothetical protein